MASQTTHQESKVTRAHPSIGFSAEEVRNISSVLNAVLADVFALYLKTKNFHWHVAGPHFRDYHLLFEEQAVELFAITDDIAERVRKIGGNTLRSIGHIAKLQRIADNEQVDVDARDMLLELHADNKALVESLRAAHEVTAKSHDFATTGMIETWIDAAERRAWFLLQSAH